MKNILRNSFIMAVAALSFVACQEDEIEKYSGPGAVNMRIFGRDSAEFSFLTVAPKTEEYVFNVDVNIQTVIADYDRTVNIGLGERTTGVLGTNFEVADQVVIPAGETSVVLPVKVFKQGLVDIEGGLVADIVVKTSDDFIGGVHDKVKLAFSGDFPKDWYSSSGDLAAIPFMIGKCTKAKYQFLFDHIGTIDLVDYASWDYGPIIALRSELNAKLDRIAAENGGVRLKDDDGSDMIFMP